MEFEFYLKPKYDYYAVKYYDRLHAEYLKIFKFVSLFKIIDQMYQRYVYTIYPLIA